MIEYTICYQTVTPESAEYGDVADHGFIDQHGFQYSLMDQPWKEWSETDKEAIKHFGTVHDFASDCEKYGAAFHPGADWAYNIDPDQDYQTGEATTYSLHIAGDRHLRLISAALAG